METGSHDGDLREFERHRARLFALAYRMLGSVHDAEDVLQEAYLRWHGTDVASVRTPEAWLVAVTTRLAIDRLRRSASERERYIGAWLPEPIGTPADRDAEVASDLSMALLVLLERLAPEERAAFLLREVFDADYAELARVLDKTEAACRQMVHRARARVRGGRARFTVPVETHERLMERFLAALEADDPEAMLALVAEDATWTSDGGGKVPSARRVIYGADRIIRLLRGLSRKYPGQLRRSLAWVNGEPALLTWLGDHLVSTTSVGTDGERLVVFYTVLNPDKLRRLPSILAGDQAYG